MILILAIEKICSSYSIETNSVDKSNLFEGVFNNLGLSRIEILAKMLELENKKAKDFLNDDSDDKKPVSAIAMRNANRNNIESYFPRKRKIEDPDGEDGDEDEDVDEVNSKIKLNDNNSSSSSSSSSKKKEDKWKNK